MARCLLQDSGNPKWLWGEAIMLANHIRNITLRPGKGIVPYVKFWAEAPGYGNLKVFSAKVYVLIPKEKRTSKMNPVCEIGMMVGYPTQARGYRILLRDGTGSYKVVARRDVVFDETQVGLDKCFVQKKRGRSPSPGPARGGELTENEVESLKGRLRSAGAMRPRTAGNEREQMATETVESGSESESDSDAPPRATGGPSPPPEAPARARRVGPPPVRGRSGVQGITRIMLDSMILTLYESDGTEYLCLVSKDENGQPGTEIIEPMTLEDALKSPQAQEWLRAVNLEMASLLSNETWDAVECPPGITPIPCKWVLKIKRNEIGEIERFKARLVAKGFRQIPGVDYNEIFSPVVRMPTVRTMLALAAAKGWKLHHLDIDTAFLHGKLQEPIYMEAPEGFEFGGKVLKLKKCIYGLKQAPKVWYDTLRSKFESQGFVISYSDNSMLVKSSKDDKAFALIYVDDQILTGPDDDLNMQVKEEILKTFPGKDLGEAHFFVGMRLQRDFEKGTLKISQRTHIEDLLNAFNMTNAKPVSVPMDTSLDLRPDSSQPYNNPQRYMSLVGSLNYLAMCTRPDIAFATGVLCRFMSKPTINHWKCALRVLHYLKGTIDYGIVYGNKATTNYGLKMIAYSDASHGDKPEAIPTYGYAFILNGAVVDWTSKKEDKIAKSTAEAEYVAASFATTKALWMNKLLADCSLPKPMPMYIDNTTALTQIQEGRNKHINIHYRFVEQSARHKDVIYHHIHTDLMTADILTKALSKTKFEQFRLALGVME